MPVKLVKPDTHEVLLNALFEAVAFLSRMPEAEQRDAYSDIEMLRDGLSRILDKLDGKNG